MNEAGVCPSTEVLSFSMYGRFPRENGRSSAFCISTECLLTLLQALITSNSALTFTEESVVLMSLLLATLLGLSFGSQVTVGVKAGVSAQADDITPEVGASVQVANITGTGLSVQVADNAELGVSVQVADITSLCFFVLFTATLEDSSPLEGSIDSNGSESFNLPFDDFFECFLLSSDR